MIGNRLKGNGRSAKEDLGLPRVCTGTRNRLSMLSGQTREGETAKGVRKSGYVVVGVGMSAECMFRD